MNSPDRDQELERQLRAALHSEANRTTPAGDGLARIRARTSANVGFSRLFRPALAGAALTFTLIAGTFIGVRMTDDGNRTDLAVPTVTGGPVVVEPPVVDPPAVDPPAVLPPANPPATSPPDALTGPAATTAPSAGPDSSAKLAVTAPPTGLASPAATCVPNMGVPPDDSGNYIAITSPGSGCPVAGRELTVSGKARVYEAALTVEVLQNNTVLKTSNVMASEGPPGLGTWSTTFSLPPGNYRIEAYALSPNDGARMVQDTIWISVTAPGSTASPAPTN